jgi:hypothetical protein
MRVSTINPTGTRRRRIPMSLPNETGASAIFARSQTPKKLIKIKMKISAATRRIPIMTETMIPSMVRSWFDEDWMIQKEICKSNK